MFGKFTGECSQYQPLLDREGQIRLCTGRTPLGLQVCKSHSLLGH